MENRLYEKWLQSLQQELETLDDPAMRPLERLRNALALTGKITSQVRDRVLKDGFSTTTDEIYFFKKIKPRLFSMQQYEVLFYSLCSNAPAGPPETIRQYYEQELFFIFRELRNNAFHYQYFRTGATELDEQYFLRAAKPSEVPILELTDPYPGFSTTLDYSFSKFIAFERLQAYLLDQLTATTLEFIPNRRDNKVSTKLKWTGESINLVEIAYGIWLTGQINHGNATITEIINWLETNLSLKIGVAYRRWAAISSRKRISVTKFIDQMRGAVLKRLDEENDLK